MTELIRDTAFGHLIRFVSRGSLLKYAEEAEPDLYKRYVNVEKSGHLADHGDTNPREDEDGTDETRARDHQQTGDSAEKRSQSRDTSDTKAESDDGNINQPSGVKVDPEKGRDKHVISWWGEHDTE